MTRAIAIAMAIAIATLASCRQAGGDDVVARAYGNSLLRADIEGLVPEGTSADDSAAIVSNYIQQWLQQQVVIEKARKNVRKSFDKELQSYKNSLIVYEYEQMVVEQLLDTNVSNDELQAYYEAHRDLFLLRQPIARRIYVKMPADAAQLPQLRKLMAKAKLTDNDLDAIQQLAATYALDYDFDGDTWHPVVQMGEEEQTTTVTHTFESKETGDASPFEFERETIRTIILNRRKIDIIENMQRHLLHDAESKGQIEIR